jgi:hypothetical protein
MSIIFFSWKRGTNKSWRAHLQTSGLPGAAQINATSSPCLGHLNSFLGDLSHKLFFDTNIEAF